MDTTEGFREEYTHTDENSCWVFNNKQNNRYPRVSRRWTGSITIHRYMWMITFGDIGNKEVLHKCDNTRCCNPDHLFLGTQSDNVKDMHNKGRHKAIWSEEARKKAGDRMRGQKRDPSVSEKIWETRRKNLETQKGVKL
jgi:hypothetical protein